MKLAFGSAHLRYGHDSHGRAIDIPDRALRLRVRLFPDQEAQKPRSSYALALTRLNNQFQFVPETRTSNLYSFRNLPKQNMESLRHHEESTLEC